MLVFLGFFGSYCNAETTTNLLEPSAQNWTGQYGTGYWGGISGGPNPNRIPNGDGFVWSYGQTALGTSIAINTALQNAGVQVDGFTYKWKVKNGNANQFTNQPGIDPFDITVDILKADGSLYKSYNYDYGYSHNWTEHTGTELFPDNFLPPSFFGNIDITATGQDSGNWAGWYGPEFNPSQSEFNLIYSTNPCYNNSLHDPNCIGYAEAYAQQLYDQQCQASALYDTGCPGYAAAYFTQQCTMDPLYNTSCPEYANTILAITEEDHHTEDLNEPDIIVSAENITVPEITGDATVDSILGDLNEIPISITELDVSSAPTEIIENEITETEEFTADETVTEAINIKSEEKAVKNPFEKNRKPDEKRKKIKKLVAAKTSSLAEKMSTAANIEAQKAVQAQVLALLNFVPGFNQYGTKLTGGFYPDAQGYNSDQLPENQRGLRNGLAQQILHRKMVDMQWER